MGPLKGQQSTDPAGDRSTIPLQRMAPNPNDLPSICLECPCDEPITLAIVGHLTDPKLGILSRGSVVPRATVPETTIHKQGDPLGRENKVGMTKYRPMASPTGDAVSFENRHQSQFGVFVPFGTNLGHQLRAVGLRVDIGHSEILSGTGNHNPN